MRARWNEGMRRGILVKFVVEIRGRKYITRMGNMYSEGTWYIIRGVNGWGVVVDGCEMCQFGDMGTGQGLRLPGELRRCN